MRPQGYKGKKYLLHIVPAIIIMAGIVLRLYVYIDNRNLWTDEVNIALNIFDKDFAGLAAGMDYMQYAPPVFLWLVKLGTMLFGYGEKALRLWPLLSGIASVFLLYSIARKNFTTVSTWYILAILATGTFYLRYSTELKQYMPDAFFALLLVYVALRLDIIRYSSRRFVGVWLLAGSIALWSSMPAVFMLSGVGCYYMATLIKERRYKKFFPLLFVSSLWLVQFLLYYFFVLQRHIQTERLVSYHEKYFPFALPATAEQWTHNRELLKVILANTFNGANAVILFNLVLIFGGVVLLMLKKSRKIWLLLTPVLLMLIAAALRQYSLIPRLTLFAMPLLLLLAGAGLDILFVRNPKLIKGLGAVICIIVFLNTRPLDIFSDPIREEQLTESMDYAIEHDITGDELYVYTGAVNSFRYYTTIHPGKSKWKQLQSAYMINDGTNLAQLSYTFRDTAALLYTIPFDSYHTKNVFSNAMQRVDSFETAGSSIYIFRKPL